MTVSSTGASALSVFTFDTHSVHTLLRDGEPWFIATDVCAALAYQNTGKAIADHVDEDDKNTVTIRYGIRGNPNKTIINESGLYALIFSSSKPEAKRFKKWVTSEVLPAIRKTGGYKKPVPGPKTLTQDMLDKLKTRVVQKLESQQYNAAINILAKAQVDWEVVDAEPVARRYHFPLEDADPHDRQFGATRLTPRVLSEPKNRALELELIEQLERDGHDVMGVKIRILAMREAMSQAEEAREMLRKVRESAGMLVEVCSVALRERGKNVQFADKPNPNDPIDRHVYRDQLRINK